MTSPFGIAFYSPLDQLIDARELRFGFYSVTAPAPHPLFETYIVRVTPALGVVWIKAIGAEIDNDAYGTATQLAVGRVRDQLTLRYGAPREVDFLMSGSIWNEPRDWMAGLAANERNYSYVWEAPPVDLPADIVSVFVGAVSSPTHTATVVIEYESAKAALADAEDDQQLSELL